MKNKCPQISQITQIVEADACLWGCKGYQNRPTSQPYTYRLCNLRNLWRKILQENL